MGAVKNLLLECQRTVHEVLEEKPHYGNPLSRTLLTDAVRNEESAVEGLDWSEVEAEMPGLVEAAIDAELEGADPLTQVAQALVASQ
jgi:hypothetical protein